MDTSLNLERTTFEIYKADVTPDSSTVHSHNNFELNYVKSGWGKRYVGDYFSSYEAGDLVLLGPNLPHCWQVDMDEKTDYPKNITIRFTVNFLDKNLMKFPELEPALQLFKNASQGIHFKGPLVGKIGIELEKLLLEEGIGRLFRLFKIFDLLTKIKDREFLSSIGYMEPSSLSDFKRINKIYEFIFLNFQKSITLKDVSSEVFMTPGSFCRYFKEKTGKSLFETVKQVRIGYACNLLYNSPKSISDIAYSSGYNTLANCYKQFKEMKGMSPKEYRKMKY